MKRVLHRGLPIVAAFAACALAGCTTAMGPPAAAPVPIAVAPQPSPPDEWNIFPDPITGTVEVYHNGADVGSVNGDEKEDPPVPQKRESDTESD